MQARREPVRAPFVHSGSAVSREPEALMANTQKQTPAAKRSVKARQSGTAVSMVTFYLNRQASSPNARRKLMTRVKDAKDGASEEPDGLGRTLA